MDTNESVTQTDKSDVIFKKMRSSGIKQSNIDVQPVSSQSMDNLCGKNDSIDFASIDSNCFIDNGSVDTVSIDNCFQDNLSIDNSSINVSMDLHEASESTLDLQVSIFSHIVNMKFLSRKLIRTRFF